MSYLLYDWTELRHRPTLGGRRSRWHRKQKSSELGLTGRSAISGLLRLNVRRSRPLDNLVRICLTRKSRKRAWVEVGGSVLA